MELEVHERLNAYLLAHCYNRAAIARAINVDPRNFNAALNGKRELRATELLDTLNVLGIRCDDLFEYNPPKRIIDQIKNKKKNTS